MKRVNGFCFVMSAVLLMILSLTASSCLPRGRSSQVYLLSSPLEGTWNTAANVPAVRDVVIPSYVNQSNLMYLKNNGTLESIPGCRWAMPMGESLREALNFELHSRGAECTGKDKIAVTVNLPLVILAEGNTLHVGGTIFVKGTNDSHQVSFKLSRKENRLDGSIASDLYRQAVKKLASEIIIFANQHAN